MIASIAEFWGDEEQANEHANERDQQFYHDGIAKARARYRVAKQAEIDTTIECSWCGKHIVKRTHHRAFCSCKCKQSFWNNVDEKRRKRAQKFSLEAA